MIDTHKYFIWAVRKHQMHAHYAKKINVKSLKKKDVLQAIRDRFGIHHDHIIFVNSTDVFNKCDKVIFKRVPSFHYQQHGIFSETPGTI